MEKNNKKKKTRYMSGFISFKTATVKMTVYEDMMITKYCQDNNISKSLFLNSAAMYCIQKGISASELLENTINATNCNYKELIENEKNI